MLVGISKPVLTHKNVPSREHHYSAYATVTATKLLFDVYVLLHVQVHALGGVERPVSAPFSLIAVLPKEAPLLQDNCKPHQQYKLTARNWDAWYLPMWPLLAQRHCTHPSITSDDSTSPTRTVQCRTTSQAVL